MILKYLLSLAIVVGGLTRLVYAYLDTTPTLGRLTRDSTCIVVLQVDKVSKEKGVIVYRKVADLKGRYPDEMAKHHIMEGLHPRESKLILDWAEPGKTAICFHNGKQSLICLDHYWYECAAREAPWWGLTRGRPELSLSYFGSAEKLRQCVAAILAGREAVVPVMGHGNYGDFLSYEAMAFKKPLRSVKTPIRRLRVSLKMPGTVQKVANNPRYLVEEGKGDAEEVSALVQALRHKEGCVRAEAAADLGRIGEQAGEAIPALRKALQDPDALVRVRAAGALVRIDPEDRAALPVLQRGMKDSDKHVRKEAAEALGDIDPKTGAAEAVSALLQALRDTDPSVRWAAVESLGQIGPEAKAAVPALIAVLPDKAIGLVAADALGEIGPQSQAAVPALMRMLQEADRGRRWAATRALIRIDVENRTAGPIVRAVEPLLVEALKDRDPYTRWEAVFYFSWMGKKAQDAVPALIGLFKDQPTSVRLSACEALQHLGPAAQAAVPALTAALADEDVSFRIGAAETLWKISADAERVVPVLVAALKDSPKNSRIQAAIALGEIGPKAKTAVSALTRLQKDKDRDVRRAAAKALRRIRAADSAARKVREKG
jgi:HEAT repeat protein